MSLTMRDPGGKDFERCPAGTHVARCYRVIDIGTHYSERFDKHHTQVMLGWEIPDEKMDDGQPFSIHATYTASLHEKAKLRQHLETWRGRGFTAEELEGFNLENILGAPCLLSVVHNERDGKTYANVAGVTALPKGTECPPAVNDPVSFDMQKPNRALLESFSDWVQAKIAASEEWRTLSHSQGVKPQQSNEDPAPQGDDDIPF